MGKCIDCKIEVPGKWICNKCSKGLSPGELIMKLGKDIINRQ